MEYTPIESSGSSSNESDTADVSLKSKTKSKTKSRKQFFSNKWLNDSRFKGWLQPLNNDKSKASCTACNTILNTKVSDLIHHSRTKKHLMKVKNIKTTSKIDVSFKKILESREEHDVIDATLRNCLMVAAHNISFRTIDHITSVTKKNFKECEVAKKMALKRTKGEMIVKNVLASVIKDKLKEELHNQRFSVLLDESTDISNKRQLCILVKYLCKSQIKTQLLDIKEMGADDGTAKGIYSLFKESLREFNLEGANVFGYCADNASVMMGSKESVKVYLRSENPSLIASACICHSVHLIAVSAADKIPPNVETLLQNISTYFSRSPKRQKILEEFQDFMKAEKLKFLKPSQTRWLALSHCIERFLLMWDVLSELFKMAAFEDQNGVASLIHNDLCSPVVKAYLYFLKYVLPIFNEFNMFFQSKKSLLHLLYSECLRFLKFLGANFLKPEFLDETQIVNINVYHPDVLNDIEQINVGPEAFDLIKHFDNNLRLQFKLNCVQFYQKAFSECLKRFPLTEFYKNIIFVIPEVALKIDSQFCDISCVAENIYANKTVDCVREYNKLKIFFSESEKENLPKESLPFWKHLQTLKNFSDEHLFKNISELALTVLLIPHGNADVERVFSLMCDVKSKKRNKMSTEMLCAILRIKIDLHNENSCCEDYVFTNKHYEKYNQNMYDHKNKKDKLAD
nr:PREDICTED: uncharacterized protein LOC103312773 [Tribolium castaneum]|eukprot:XP_008192464.1 PREDICTED: uncharacterized protein LOC103312773 [Tribolium castaneum]